MPTLRNGNKEGFEPGSIDCESGILPLSYRAIISMMKNHGRATFVCCRARHLGACGTAKPAASLWTLRRDSHSMIISQRCVLRLCH